MDTHYNMENFQALFQSMDKDIYTCFDETQMKFVPPETEEPLPDTYFVNQRIADLETIPLLFIASINDNLAQQNISFTKLNNLKIAFEKGYDKFAFLDEKFVDLCKPYVEFHDKIKGILTNADKILKNKLTQDSIINLENKKKLLEKLKESDEVLETQHSFLEISELQPCQIILGLHMSMDRNIHDREKIFKKLDEYQEKVANSRKQLAELLDIYPDELDDISDDELIEDAKEELESS